jgi:hypothetical protein
MARRRTRARVARAARRVARDLPLRDGPAGHRYLNAGTWSTMRRDGQPESGDRLRFIEIEHGNGRPPIARLRGWEPSEWPITPPIATGARALRLRERLEADDLVDPHRPSTA